ncbi:nucleotide sugar dehydrogenase [bacterium]|nr:nucleotide sugar dehydrogenase [bacterium]
MISEQLLKKIQEKDALLAVIGMGYVGLPLAVEMAQAGFQVTGIDIDQEKMRMLNKGISYIQDISSDQVYDLVQKGFLQGTPDFSILKSVDCISICVPTPLRKTRDPDISFIINATNEVKNHLHSGQLIILESTSYPGTTEEIMLQQFEETGLKVGQDYFLCFSPERVDPGNTVYMTRNTPKIIGGITPACSELGRAFYECFIDTVIPVSSARAAEMVKLLENTFRSVNIGLVNEIALMCDRLEIDVWEVIEAAASKPFGFMPFYPGPGLGGHCIPIDPVFLSWKLKTLNYTARFIDLATEINTHMPHYVVSKVTLGLNRFKKAVNGSRILIMGVSYKRDIDDIRESPAIDIFRLLQAQGAVVSYTDPFVPILRIDGQEYTSIELTGKNIPEFDAVVITTDHTRFDLKQVVEQAQLIIDTRNATKKLGPKDTIIKI